MKKELTRIESNLKEKEINLSEKLAALEKENRAVEENGLLISKYENVLEEKNNVERIMSSLDNIKIYILLNETEPILKKVIIYENLYALVWQENEKLINAKDTLRRKEQIQRLNDSQSTTQGKLDKCSVAINTFNHQKKLSDVTKGFLNENVKQIELFFKLLHRPKEFSNLKIKEGKIHLIRKSTQTESGTESMSTGQKMALSIALLLTLHLTAENAPKMLILDEPVANLDDMHVLNLVDLLRELAINNTQIILTTANKQIANYLRRKFSFFENEYYHYELHRKGDDMTQIIRKTYSPKEKKANSSEILCTAR